MTARLLSERSSKSGATAYTLYYILSTRVLVHLLQRDRPAHNNDEDDHTFSQVFPVAFYFASLRLANRYI